MLTYFVFHNGAHKKTFENCATDKDVFIYLLRAQSNSTDWAQKFEGWRVECLDTTAGKTFDYRTGKEINNPLNKNL